MNLNEKLSGHLSILMYCHSSKIALQKLFIVTSLYFPLKFYNRKRDWAIFSAVLVSVWFLVQCCTVAGAGKPGNCIEDFLEAMEPFCTFILSCVSVGCSLLHSSSEVSAVNYFCAYW